VVVVVVVVIDFMSGKTALSGLNVFSSLLEPAQLNFSIISDGF